MSPSSLNLAQPKGRLRVNHFWSGPLFLNFSSPALIDSPREDSPPHGVPKANVAEIDREETYPETGGFLFFSKYI
jgi:hypothetical protein